MIDSGAHGQIIYIVILDFAIFGTFMLLYQSPFYLFILMHFKRIFNPSLTIKVWIAWTKPKNDMCG